jgi:hypothetical protein
MQAACSNAIHGAVAMAIEDIGDPDSRPSDGHPVYRYLRIAMRLVDGSVWQVEPVLVPVRESDPSLRAVAWWCKQGRTSRGRRTPWKMIVPPQVAV